MKTELQEIGEEIIRWGHQDRLYTQTLIVYALQKGFITEEDAKTCTEELNEWWNEHDPTAVAKDDKRKKAMMNMLEKEKDFTMCSIFWKLFYQFPDHNLGAPDYLMVPDIKLMDVDSKVYYEKINKLKELGYIDTVIDKKKKKQTICIHFDRL